MKIKLTAMGLLLASFTTTVLAVHVMSFPGWNWLQENSQDIVIARCSQTPLQSFEDDVIDSPIEIISVLKDATNWGKEHLEQPTLWAAHLSSQYWLKQGENYLIFSIYYSGQYQAIEEYRVIPLGINFSTNSIIGKPMDEQIQILLKRRLANLNREMQADQEEKQRLETGLK